MKKEALAEVVIVLALLVGGYYLYQSMVAANAQAAAVQAQIKQAQAQVASGTVAIEAGDNGTGSSPGSIINNGENWLKAAALFA